MALLWKLLILKMASASILFHTLIFSQNLRKLVAPTRHCRLGLRGREACSSGMFWELSSEKFSRQ